MGAVRVARRRYHGRFPQALRRSASNLRAKRAGFDLIYVYAGHALTAAAQFLLRRYNDRTDEYGGSLENRTRLFRRGARQDPREDRRTQGEGAREIEERIARSGR